MSKFQDLSELADAAKGAADRSSESIDDALSFIEKSNLRIEALENSHLLDQRLLKIFDRRCKARIDLFGQP